MHPGYRIRNQEGIYFITFAVVEWVDVFTRKDYAEIVIESLQYCQKEKGLIVYAWCLMSNHLHLIIAAKEGFQLRDILRDFKKFTSYQITKAIEDSKTESRRTGLAFQWMLWIFKAAGDKNKKNKKYQFWHRTAQCCQFKDIPFAPPAPKGAIQRTITMCAGSLQGF